MLEQRHPVVKPSSDPTAVLQYVPHGADLIVPLANGEPKVLLDTIDAHANDLRGVRVHQMHALYDRPYLHGAYGDRLRHAAYFLSHVSRKAYNEGGCDLVPANFSEVPMLLQQTTKCSLVLAAASPPDRHGYFSLGTNADYTARFIGQVPFFLEVEPEHAADVRREHPAHQPGGRVDRGRLPAARDGSTVDRRQGLGHRRTRRRTYPRRRDDPGRHRRDPERDPRAAEGPP